MDDGTGDKSGRLVIAYMKVTKKRLVYHGMKMEEAGTIEDSPVYSYPRNESVSYKIDDCNFFDLHGKPVDVVKSPHD